MRKTLVVEPFGASISLIIGEKDRSKHAKEYGLQPPEPGESAAFHRVDSPFDAPEFVLHLPEKRDIEIMYHEALHLTTALLEYYCIPISHANDEIMAYLQAYIVREIDRLAYKGGKTRK